MKAAVLAAALLATLAPAIADPFPAAESRRPEPGSCIQGDLDATWGLAFTSGQKPVFCTVDFNKKGTAKGFCSTEVKGKAKLDETCTFRAKLEIGDETVVLRGVLSSDKSVMLGSISEGDAIEPFSILHGIRLTIGLITDAPPAATR